MSHINYFKTGLTALIVSAAIAFSPSSSAALTAYSQDFEAVDASDPGALGPSGEDFLIWADVWGKVGGDATVGTDTFIYNYGPFPAPNGGPGFSAIAGGEGSVNQGTQYLNTYSDYNNPDQIAGGYCGANDGCTINTSVFREAVLDASDVNGDTWAFTFDAKSPFQDGIFDGTAANGQNPPGDYDNPQSASAFIKTLDPNNGYWTTNDIRVDMTNISNDEWATFSISIVLSDAALDGLIIQYGFNTVSTEYGASGVYYDNLSFVKVSKLVTIDIKPDSQTNNINPGSQGVIAVSILTSEDFDALQVDPDTVLFGPADAEKAHTQVHVEDVDNDGDMDLVFHFRTQETGIQCGDTEATLTGETWDGTPISGTDSVTTVGCE